MSTQPRPLTGKAREDSIERLAASIQIIEDLAPKEQKREARRRRKAMEQAYESMRLHAGKLGIELPRLSTFYFPEQYLAHAQIAAEKLKEMQQP